MNKKNHFCFRVALSLPIKETFSYAVSNDLAPVLLPGYRVLVPFHNRKIIGYTLERVPLDPNLELKEIIQILDETPLFSKQLIPLLEWMAKYYFCPIGHVIQKILPGGLNPTIFKTASLTEKGLQLLGSNKTNPETRDLLSLIKKSAHKRLPIPLNHVYSLRRQGLIVLLDSIKKASAKPLVRKFIKPNKGINLSSLLDAESRLPRPKNEINFLKTIYKDAPILVSDLTKKYSNGAYLVKKWSKDAALEIYSASVFRDPSGKMTLPVTKKIELNKHQKLALKQIKINLLKKTFSTCLLYGVTGSGKTEVYIKAIEHVFSQNRQAILMLPEISLAIFMEGLLKHRFKEPMAIYHSGLSKGERYDQWMRISRGEVGLVIGARSALFAPLPRLGLIIVDEEHDPSYKQENIFHYQARDTAVMRSKLENALVILGSGTPSVQSYQNCLNNRYQLLSMPDRVEEKTLPAIEIVDMKLFKGNPQVEIFSPQLAMAIKDNLDAKKQTILFLNRRGFHQLFICLACGQQVQCPNCDIVLTYHLKTNHLACHYCGFVIQPPKRCSNCGHTRLKAYGFGTERLEHEVKDLFPDAQIARIDSDTIRRKGQASQILEKFSSQETDILVGTQMITKGFDFPGVTLVGIIAADISLGFPDFRAAERTFQIISQVAGRSGRGSQKGRVIIQTFNSGHYAIKTACNHDYDGFFKMERDLRAQLSYPPFGHLVCFKFKGNNKTLTEQGVRQFSLEVKKILGSWAHGNSNIRILGPVEAPIAKIKNKYRWQVLIKCKQVKLMQYFIKESASLSQKILKPKGIHFTVDVDPYQMS